MLSLTSHFPQSPSPSSSIEWVINCTADLRGLRRKNKRTIHRSPEWAKMSSVLLSNKLFRVIVMATFLRICGHRTTHDERKTRFCSRFGGKPSLRWRRMILTNKRMCLYMFRFKISMIMERRKHHGPEVDRWRQWPPRPHHLASLHLSIHLSIYPLELPRFSRCERGAISPVSA